MMCRCSAKATVIWKGCPYCASCVMRMKGAEIRLAYMAYREQVSA